VHLETRVNENMGNFALAPSYDDGKQRLVMIGVGVAGLPTTILLIQTCLQVSQSRKNWVRCLIRSQSTEGV
jgi:hypothetical protein